MVNVRPENSTVNITVSSSGTSGSVNVTPDYAHYYSEKAREWAISNRMVDGVDYSSKYYASRANQSALNAQSFAQSAQDSYEQFQDSVDGALSNIDSSVQGAIEDINNTKTGILTDIEFVADGEKEEIQGLADEIKDNAEDIINRVGISMFDTKISDHILEGDEAKGWALQGTYVTKDLYPDFYSKCLEQKNNAIESQITLGSSTLTMFVNSNGHQFYNIVDKSIVDTFYNSNGIADFYGFDEENERIFLPRNKYFAIQGVAPVVGNGMALGMTDGANYGGTISFSYTSTSGQNVAFRNGAYGLNIGENGNIESPSSSNTKVLGITEDPTKSGIEAHLKPNENKYLYYCVGNTVVNDAQIDAGGLVAQMEQKANIFLDNVLPNSEFKNKAVSWGMPDYSAAIELPISLTSTDFKSYDFPIMLLIRGSNGAGGTNGYGVRLEINGATPSSINLTGYNYNANTCTFYLDKNTQFKVYYNSGVPTDTTYCYVYPLKSNN